MDASDLHKLVFIELFRDYLSKCGVAHGYSEPREVGSELFVEASKVVGGYVMSNLRKPIAVKSEDFRIVLSTIDSMIAQIQLAQGQCNLGGISRLLPELTDAANLLREAYNENK